MDRLQINLALALQILHRYSIKICKIVYCREETIITSITTTTIMPSMQLRITRNSQETIRFKIHGRTEHLNYLQTLATLSCGPSHLLLNLKINKIDKPSCKQLKSSQLTLVKILVINPLFRHQ